MTSDLGGIDFSDAEWEIVVNHVVKRLVRTGGDRPASMEIGVLLTVHVGGHAGLPHGLAAWLRLFGCGVEGRRALA
jgi:hypothetical protein